MQAPIAERPRVGRQRVASPTARAGQAPIAVARSPARSAHPNTERLDQIEKASACQRRPRGDARRASGGQRNARRLTLGLGSQRPPTAQAQRRASRPATASLSSTSSAAAGARSSATSTRARSTTSCPAWRRRSSTSASRRTASCTSTRSCCRASRRPSAAAAVAAGARSPTCSNPGQEIVVQVVKDPLKTKGARLSMELTIAGRYMVYAPTGEGIGVSRRLEDKERERLRRQTAKLDARRRRRDHPHRRPRRQARGLRARAEVPAQAARGAREARRGDRRARPRLPGGRPVGARRARHLLRALRAGDRRRRAAVPPARLVLHAHRPRAGRARRAVGRQRSRCSRPTRSTRRSRACSRVAWTCPAAAI